MTAGVYAELSANGTRIFLAVAGDDWEINAAAVALRTLTPLLKHTEPRGMLCAPATWVTVTQLAHTFSTDALGRWIPGPRLREWTLNEFLKRTAAEEQPAVAQEIAANTAGPAKQLQLRPYQNQGASMLASAGKFLLFDEPGTGKTATTVTGLLRRHRAGTSIYPLLIVVPSWDVADVWAREIGTWAPELGEPVMYAGPNRGKLLAAGSELAANAPKPAAAQAGPARQQQHAARPVGPATETQILITTYATARIDAATAQGPLAKLRPAAVVADEVHFIKNHRSKQSQAVRRIAAHAGTFAGLSGTPVTRDTGDIHPALEAMDPDSWPSGERFRKRYLLIQEDEYSQTVQGLDPRTEAEFFTAIQGQHRRVAKADVLDQLPPKVHSVRRVELPPAWHRAYRTLEKDMLARLPDGTEMTVMSVLAQLTRLSQLASSAFDAVPKTNEDGSQGWDVTLREPSWKADVMLEILAERKGQQCVVFGVSRQLILIAERLAREAGYRTGLLTGKQGRRERQDGIDDFQAGKLDVMLATTGAGSLGITLTAAGTAIFLQRPWEYDKAVQPEDRLHRIGQEHDCVEVIDIVAKGTVDERVRELLRVKGGQLGQLVRDPRIARELLGGLR